MSLQSVELWRPRREPKDRVRRTLAAALVCGVLIGSVIAASVLRRPLVLGLGLVATLVLAFASLWLLGGGTTWVATLPRPWVPRVPGARRGPSARDRRAARGSSTAPPTAPAPCNSQPAPPRVAIGRRPPL